MILMRTKCPLPYLFKWFLKITLKIGVIYGVLPDYGVVRTLDGLRAQNNSILHYYRIGTGQY